MLLKNIACINTNTGTWRKLQLNAFQHSIVSNSNNRYNSNFGSYINDSCMDIETLPKVIVISGATGVGKSDIALKLCETITQNISNYNKVKLNNISNTSMVDKSKIGKMGKIKLVDNRKCEIVIADSVQIYKHLNIGSTKPTTNEMTSVEHHLVGNVDLSTQETGLTAGSYVDCAMEAIESINSRGNIAIVVGGATMWIDWLLYGKPKLAKLTSKKVRERVQESLALYQYPHNNNDSVQILTREERWKAAIDCVCSTINTYINSNSNPNSSTMVNTSKSKDVNKTESLRALLPLVSKVHNNNYKQLSRYMEIAISTSEDSEMEEDVGGNSGNSSTSSGNGSSGSNSATTSHSDHSKGLFHMFPPRPDGTERVKCFFLTSPRVTLYNRIDERCIRMLEKGLLTEVTSLLINNHLVDISSTGSGTGGGSNPEADPSSNPTTNINPQSNHTPSVNTPTLAPAPVYTASAAVIASQSIGYRQSIEFLMLAARSGGDSDTSTGTGGDLIYEQFQHYLR